MTLRAPVTEHTYRSAQGVEGGKWVVCQIGAREHYAVARALHREGRLAALLTEAWARPGALPARFSRGLAGRFHSDLAAATIHAPGAVEAIAREAALHLRHRNGWSAIMERNRQFQEMAVRRLERMPDGDLTVFAYSYAARAIFAYARTRGWRTVLGQIDPGPFEERVVARLHGQSQLRADWSPAPPEYWENWRAECELADAVVVNSIWSRDALLQEGIPAEKLKVVPLAFETPANARGFERRYPLQFTMERPMRVLFLGQINLRKGVEPLFEAIRLVENEPMEFWFVGPVQVEVPLDLRDTPRVRWFGPVARSATEEFYRTADIFVLPTFSDGFGLTQLEARAWRLPIVASRCCGGVVEEGLNGYLLAEITGQVIAGALMRAAQTAIFETGFSLADGAKTQTASSFALLARNLLSIK